MTDIADEAQEIEEAERAASIERARQCEAVDPEVVETIACSVCGSEIEEARRKAIKGVRRCVECQAERERLGRFMGKRTA